VRAAADAALALVTSVLRRWVRAEPAADFAAALAFGLLGVLAAAAAALLPVLSLAPVARRHANATGKLAPTA
jgi:hypothetical protein